MSLRRPSINCLVGPAAALAILVGAALPAWSAAPGGASGGPGGPSWSQLSPAQQAALAPLRNDWNQLDLNRKQKWTEVASRFGTMSPPQQERVRERMTNWARMSPNDRAEARLNYQRTKRLGREDKRARWEAYQALPTEERAALAARAKPAPIAEPPVSPAQSLRKAPVDAFAPKSNIVTATPNAPPTRSVAPTVVQGGPGATTRLLTAAPTPPAHQPAGQPKIAATPKLVDKTTLLPKSGAQAAGQSTKTARAPEPVPAAPTAPKPPPIGPNAQ